MQSAKKRAKVLSALSIAAGATLATQMASGAVLTMFYDNVAVIDNTWSYNGPAFGQNANSVGSGNIVTSETPISTIGAGGTAAPIVQGAVNTINMSVGQVLEFGLDAVLTGNTNPDGGKTTNGTGTKGTVQPLNLGTASIAVRIPSSDGTGQTLLPLTDGGPAAGTYSGAGGQPFFNASDVVNSTGGGANVGKGGVADPNTTPSYQGGGPGDTSPTTVGQGGAVGIGFQIVGGNTSLNGTDSKGKNAASVRTLNYFAGVTPTMAESTDFFDSLSYQAGKAGTVTLSPFADPSGTTYWSLQTAGGSTSLTPSIYKTNFFQNAGDALAPLPVLVINITSAVSASIPI